MRLKKVFMMKPKGYICGKLLKNFISRKVLSETQALATISNRLLQELWLIHLVRRFNLYQSYLWRYFRYVIVNIMCEFFLSSGFLSIFLAGLYISLDISRTLSFWLSIFSGTVFTFSLDSFQRQPNCTGC